MAKLREFANVQPPGRSNDGELRETHGTDISRRINEKTVDAAFEAVEHLLETKTPCVQAARVVSANYGVYVKILREDVFRNLHGFIYVPIAIGLTTKAVYALLCEAIEQDD